MSMNSGVYSSGRQAAIDISAVASAVAKESEEDLYFQCVFAMGRSDSAQGGNDAARVIEEQACGRHGVV